MAEKADDVDLGEGEEEIDEELEWELDEGIPQFEDPFIQKYFQGRDALIAQEKKQRHGTPLYSNDSLVFVRDDCNTSIAYCCCCIPPFICMFYFNVSFFMSSRYLVTFDLTSSVFLDVVFKNSMTPIASRASKILSAIRKRELSTIWMSSYESSVEAQEHETLYPGMMFTLARDRMVKTDLFKIIERMPKGALLHAHLDAMIDVDWLIEQVLGEEGMCILWPEDGGVSETVRKGSWGRAGGVQFRVYGREDVQKHSGAKGIWQQGYKALTPIPIIEAARSFPEGGERGFKNWLIEKCVITNEESLCHHQGLDAIWRKFQSTFPTIGWMLFYEPVMRKALQRLFWAIG